MGAGSVRIQPRGWAGSGSAQGPSVQLPGTCRNPRGSPATRLVGHNLSTTGEPIRNAAFGVPDRQTLRLQGTEIPTDSVYTPQSERSCFMGSEPCRSVESHPQGHRRIVIGSRAFRKCLPFPPPLPLPEVDPVGLGDGPYWLFQCSPVSPGTRVEMQSLRPALEQEGDRAEPPKGAFSDDAVSHRARPKGPQHPCPDPPSSGLLRGEAGGTMVLRVPWKGEGATPQNWV